MSALTPAAVSDPIRLAERARHVALRMIRERPAARYLRDDAISAAVLGALSAAARGARDPMCRANGAVRDLLRAELPRGYRQPRHGRDGMPATVYGMDLDGGHWRSA